MKYFYEMLFLDKPFDGLEWEDFFDKFSNLQGYMRFWKLFICVKDQEISFYLSSNYKLNAQISGILNVFFKEADLSFNNYFKENAIYLRSEEDFFTFYYKCLRKGRNPMLFEFSFNSTIRSYHKCYFYYEEKGYTCRSFLRFVSFSKFISFSKNTYFQFKKIPKYINIPKQYSKFSWKEENAICEIFSFPCSNGLHYLHLDDYDFFKHSLILGSSGSGKSKFLCLFLESVLKTKKKYKVFMIDPHASLEKDLGGFDGVKVIDFQDKSSGIDLFTFTNNILVNCESYLSLFQGLLKDQYNSKMERVLRFSFFLLLEASCFTFLNFRKILVDSF